MIIEKITVITNAFHKKILNDDYLVISLFVVLFFSIGLINIVNHEPWRDEIEAWLIAKDSNSIPELFRNFRLEGHPCLWFLGLYVISRFSDQIFVMQIFHLLIATGAVLLILKYSPFTKLQKVLLGFSYFLFYEYAVISRNYAIGILLIFSICSIFQTRTKTFLPLSILLFLLCQTNIFGLIMALVFGFTLIFEFAIDKNLRRAYATIKWNIIISVFIFILGIWISILQMLPPPDSVHVVGWYTDFSLWRIFRTLKLIWYSYCPIPKIEVNFWGTNILKSGSIQIYFVCILILCACIFFVRKPVILYVYSLGTFGMLAFFYSKYFGSSRHHGHLFILLIVCLWLSNHYSNIELKSNLIDKLTNFFNKIRPMFITILFFCHFIAAAIAIGFDWKYPFSASKEVAKYIKEKKMDHLTIAGDPDYATQFVSAYLNKRIYYPIGDRFGTFVIWDNESSKYKFGGKWWNKKYLQNVLSNLQKLSKQRGEDILLILNYPINLSYPFIWLKSFDQSIVIDETYNLYLIKFTN